MPTGCNIYSNTQSTNVVSLLANPVTGGNSVVMTISSVGNATYEFWPINLANAPIASPGTYVFGLAEIEFDVWQAWGGATFQLAEIPGSANQTTYGMAVGTPVPIVPDQGRRWLITPPLKLDSTATAVSPQITVYNLPGTATGSGVFKIHRWGVFPVADPHGAWHS